MGCKSGTGTGATGAQGAPGPAGPTGATGATGPTGAKGDSGAQGTAGTPGAKGDKGDTGTQGPAGDAGAQGAKGDKGDTGAKGDKGDTGAIGPQGDAGTPGAALSIVDASNGSVWAYILSPAWTAQTNPSGYSVSGDTMIWLKGFNCVAAWSGLGAYAYATASALGQTVYFDQTGCLQGSNAYVASAMLDCIQVPEWSPTNTEHDFFGAPVLPSTLTNVTVYSVYIPADQFQGCNSHWVFAGCHNVSDFNCGAASSWARQLRALTINTPEVPGFSIPLPASVNIGVR